MPLVTFIIIIISHDVYLKHHEMHFNVFNIRGGGAQINILRVRSLWL
jgi:hypothetical protein